MGQPADAVVYRLDCKSKLILHEKSVTASAKGCNAFVDSLCPQLIAGVNKQETLEHGSVMKQEAASCLFRNLVRCSCAVQDDLGEDAVCSTADAASKVCSDLSGDQIGIRALGGEDQVNAKGSALSCDNGQLAFDFINQLLFIC